MDAFGNFFSIKASISVEAFTDLMCWLGDRTKTELYWMELKEFGRDKVSGEMVVVLIYVDPAKAVLHPEAWGELLQILGFKKDSGERTPVPVEQICTKCGAHSKIEAKFCSVCGTSLELAKVRM